MQRDEAIIRGVIPATTREEKDMLIQYQKAQLNRAKLIIKKAIANWSSETSNWKLEAERFLDEIKK